MINKSVALLHKLPLFIVCVLVLAPVLMLALSWFSLDRELWQHLWRTQLPELIANTLVLLFGVGAGVAVLGVPLAWLTAICEFPGRRFFDWALILPLAIPPYVLAFITLGIYDFGGVVQSVIQALGYPGYLDARHPLMVVWVMSAVLYPYVYLMVRTAFLNQGTHLLNVAQTLGRSPFRAFFEASLPAVRPALVAGMSLALMEALSDFGAVSIFGFNTFTTAIYKSWFDLFSLQTASQLATLLLLFVLLCLCGERASSRGTMDSGRSRSVEKERIILPARWKYLATVFCSLILVSTVVAPLAQLLVWACSHPESALNANFLWLIVHTFTLGLVAAAIVLGLAIAISAARFAHGQNNARYNLASELAGIGYALPGSVLAIGVMLCLSALDTAYLGLGEALGKIWQPVFLGSLAGLLAAYVIRFFRPGYGSVQAGFDAVHKNYIESAELMGVCRWQRFTGITVPLILPGVLTGALIVFVDVIREMPASLLLRPFGWDTLAVRLYELTSEGEWKRAATPALTLLMVSLAPVLVLIRKTQSSGGS